MEPSENASSANSDLNDLNLPEVGEGQEPTPLAEPTFDQQLAHAWWLLQQKGPDYWKKRRERTSPKPFRWFE